MELQRESSLGLAAANLTFAQHALRCWRDTRWAHQAAVNRPPACPNAGGGYKACIEHFGLDRVCRLAAARRVQPWHIQTEQVVWLIEFYRMRNGGHCAHKRLRVQLQHFHVVHTSPSCSLTQPPDETQTADVRNAMVQLEDAFSASSLHSTHCRLALRAAEA